MTLRSIALRPGADLDGFRQAVRRLIAADVPPDEVVWDEGETLLLPEEERGDAANPIPLPRAVGALVGCVILHRQSDRFGLLYALIWTCLHGHRSILEEHNDPLVHRLRRMESSVRRDIHKMQAFLRFRHAGERGGRERFVAWFEPEHHILEAVGPFFRDRFPGQDWSILTPRRSLHWNGKTLTVGPPASRSEAPQGDPLEAGWSAYYQSVFNPARVNPKAMRSEMPKKYWPNMPETRAIPRMIRTASGRTEEMLDKEPAPPLKRPPLKSLAAMDRDVTTLEELNRIITTTEPLVKGGVRAVLGEGPIAAAIALVGEQPGDQEDLAGRPFVGPAGQLLDRALAEAGIVRSQIYLTNAVKHFKFIQRGKHRLHQKPTAGEIKHYRWWLMKELEIVRPRLTVALGGSAALALSGGTMSVTKSRGRTRFGDFEGYVTVHPSYLLRVPDEDARRRGYEDFVADLRKASRIASRESASGE